MSDIGTLVERLVECGLSVAEASSIIAEAVAAGAASASFRRSSGALRTEKWRVTKRHKASQCDTQSAMSESVTKRHKASQSVTSDNTPLSILSKDNRKRGERLSQDWSPSEADRAFASNLGWSSSQIDSEADNFRDYWLSKPGGGGVKLDWARTWSKWIRNSKIKPAGTVATVRDTAPVDWDAICANYKKFGMWSKHAPGNEPGLSGCQCPPHILEKHRIIPVGPSFVEIPKLRAV